MNNLNSVLIEGRVLAFKSFEKDEYIMSIACRRVDREIRITIIFKDNVARLFEAYKETAAGRIIRVLSRIDTFDSAPAIYAEHFEWSAAAAAAAQEEAQEDKEGENHQ